MLTPRTLPLRPALPLRIASLLVLVTAAGLTGWSGTAGAAPPAISGACGTSPVGAPDWPAELPVGTRLASEVGVGYLVETDCGALTLVRSGDPTSCYSMTGYGLQRHPC
jgi:hypothetical protein